MSEQDTEQLRSEIARTRAELGATVEALSHKADVKAHARARAEQAKLQVRQKVGLAKVQAREKAELARAQAKQTPALPLAIGIGVGLVALWMIRRRKRS